MAFQRKQWKDRLVETPNRRKLINVTTEEETIVDITREEGEVLSIGDRFDEANMNNLELRIKEGFDTLADVAETGSYKDLSDTPQSLPANGGEADSIKGLGNADAIKRLISQAGGDGYKPADYTEGNSPYFETPFNVRYKPAKEEDYDKLETPIIAKYSDDPKIDAITTSIAFLDDGMELFNVKIQPIDTVVYTDNPEKMGFVTKFEDNSTISGKAVIVSGVFQGIKFSNGKMWNFSFGSGDFPDFE